MTCVHYSRKNHKKTTIKRFTIFTNLKPTSLFIVFFKIIYKKNDVLFTCMYNLRLYIKIFLKVIKNDTSHVSKLTLAALEQRIKQKHFVSLQHIHIQVSGCK